MTQQFPSTAADAQAPRGFATPHGIRMVATDLDGTVVPHGRPMSPRTIHALRSADEAGLRVVFVTGRPPRWLEPVVEATSHAGYAICANGAITLDLATDSVVSVRSIAAETILEVAERLRSAVPDVIFAVETPESFRVEDGYEDMRGARPAEGSEPQELMRMPRASTRHLPDLLDDEPVIKLVAISPGSTPDALLTAGRRHLGDLVTATHSSIGTALLEMSPLGTTKATGLTELAAFLEIDPRTVIAFGDMPNDIEMLRWAGTGYAMSGGHPDALAAADQIAPPAELDGVAQVLEAVLARDAGRLRP
ncbi:HAD family hydrolase [Georgenia sp. SYP-B2076]|uniref:HAD family hydrolase n=1 Tax=Georgenia sp. SYP-B2076 TaxID=2495881 RepID=UPI000F8DD4AE|nr:HAD family hydrolase [Georgenia sp. SYP-B2076]